MKHVVTVLMGMLVILSLSSCSDDTSCLCTTPDTYVITGRVLYADSLGAPASGATVFMSREDWHSFLDTVRTDIAGTFRFNDVSEGPFCLFAGKYADAGDSSFSHVGPISGVMNISGETIFNAGDLFVRGVSDLSSLTGQVALRLADGAHVAARGMSVILYDLSGLPFSASDTTVTDTSGFYSFENVGTGNYFVRTNRTMENVETGHIFCDGVNSYVNELLVLNEILARKPAIYIYPHEDSRFLVELAFNNGAALTTSIPEYGSGWDVFVETSGRIDNEYDYLFYEASLAAFPALSGGWCFHHNRLDIDLRDRLLGIGLNETETTDLLDYWGAYLTAHDYYSVYPLFDTSLDEMVELHISPHPDATLRVWLFFEGRETFESLPAPQAPPFTRGATTVVEWGGVLLN